jgi:hypothetical protein
MVLKFILITDEKVSIQRCAKADFEYFLEETVGVNFGHRQLNESVIIEDNILDRLNPLATKIFGCNLYGNVVIINKCDNEYLSLTDIQLEVLYENK